MWLCGRVGCEKSGSVARVEYVICHVIVSLVVVVLRRLSACCAALVHWKHATSNLIMLLRYCVRYIAQCFLELCNTLTLLVDGCQPFLDILQLLYTGKQYYYHEDALAHVFARCSLKQNSGHLCITSMLCSACTAAEEGYPRTAPSPNDCQV